MQVQVYDWTLHLTIASGNTLGEQRYYRFGETRVTTGTIPTDKLFTGQREIAGLGIYHYGARFYSPKLGRFLSPDGIIPSYTNPQDLNRFSYVGNNPLLFIDPTGHRPEYGDAGKKGCSNPTYCNKGQEKSKQELAAMRREKRRDDAPAPVRTPASTNSSSGGGVQARPKPITIPVISGSNPYINVQLSSYNLPNGYIPVYGGPLALVNVPTSGGIGLQIYNPAPGKDLDDLILHSEKNKSDIEFIKDLMKKLGLDPNDREARRKLHDWITGQNLTDEEIEDEVKELAREKKKKDGKKKGK
jgi:RHS repeat-associated protein